MAAPYQALKLCAEHLDEYLTELKLGELSWSFIIYNITIS